ncbi:MAG: site-2 protease family protein [Deltaproteobacteria bacterium]|nr:site-2 protease family protein [Deltaproteobacteria bacterium]
MLYNILIIVPPLLVAVMLHEIAHGYVALRLGDDTAKRQGRLTLNPIKHIDPFMTVILPALLIFTKSPVVIGGAKPVPINPMAFKDPRRGMLWVAAAGPAINFVLAGLSFLGLLLWQFCIGSADSISMPVLVIGAWLEFGVVINIVLAIFNLIPIPPLDGGRIAVGILPISLARRLASVERYGIIIVILLLYLLSSIW